MAYTKKNPALDDPYLDSVLAATGTSRSDVPSTIQSATPGLSQNKTLTTPARTPGTSPSGLAGTTSGNLSTPPNMVNDASQATLAPSALPTGNMNMTMPTGATAGTSYDPNAAAGATAGLFGGTGVRPTTGGSGGGGGGTAANPNQQYIDQLNSLYNQIMGRGAFSYDLQGDPLYRQYADQYTQLGQQAMRNTQAQSAALTGGYGNSWASSAGSQAYQQYLDQLNSVIPSLYDRAYQAWKDEGDDLMTQYKLAASHPSMISAMTPTVSSGGGGGGSSSKSNSNYKTDINSFEDMLDAIIKASESEDTKLAADNASYAQWYNLLQGGNAPSTAPKTGSSNLVTPSGAYSGIINKLTKKTK